MPGKIPGAEGDSECGERLDPEMTTASSSRSSDAKSGRNDGKNKAHLLKFIADKICTIIAVFVITALTIGIISLAVTKTTTDPSCSPLASQSVACPDFWIGYRGKCFYLSKEDRNWTLSLKICSSLNASLAVIDTQNELDFWVHLCDPFHTWFGLSSEVNKIWKWSNGAEFKTQFPVRGEGFCAYIDRKGASSTICSMEKRFLCSRTENCYKP